MGSLTGLDPGGLGSVFRLESDLATSSRSLACDSVFTSGFAFDAVNAPAAAAATPPDVFDIELGVGLVTGGESVGDLSSICRFGLLNLAYVRE